MKILPEQNRIIGYTTRNSGGVPENFKNYFVIEFDKPFTYKASVADGVLTENKVEQEAGHAGAVIGFKTRKGEVVHARVASSFIGFEQADRNLKELGNDNLETLVQKGQDAWNKVLGRIDVEGGTLTSTVLSTHVCIVPCCSRVHSMNWMRREIRFITVPTMGKCCPAICIRIPVSGTLSAVFSHSST